MAIRFQCAACSQPIEVDDEWAMRMVACPYCRRTVTAPRESFLPEISEIPTAKPSGPPTWPEQPELHGTHPPYVQRGPSMGLRPNHVGMVGLILATLSIVFLFAFWLIGRNHKDEVLEIGKAVQSGGIAQVMKFQQEMMEKNGGTPPMWLMMLGLLELAGGMAWLAGLVCALFGMRAVYDRRDKAIVALVLCGLFPFMLCCGGTLI